MYVPIRDALSRLANFYQPLPGIKVQVRVRDIKQTLYLLGQEGDYLIFSPTRTSVRNKLREYQMLLGYMLDEFERVDAKARTRGVPVFLHGRVSVHMLDLTGRRAWVEIHHLRPDFGGLFISPNHLLGLVIQDFYTRLTANDIMVSDPPDLVENWSLTPVKAVTQHLPPDLLPVASFHIIVADNGGSTVLTAVYPEIQKEAQNRISHDQLMLWAYAQLCREAADRWLLRYQPGYISLQHHEMVH